MTTLAPRKSFLWFLPIFGLAAFSPLFAAPAHSAPVIASGFWEETKYAACTNVQDCTMTFTSVPAGKNLNINTVACRIYASATALLSDLLVSQALSRHTRLQPQLVSTLPATRVWLVNNEMTKIIQGNSAASIVVVFSTIQTAIGMGCAITGKLLNAN